MKDSSRPNQFSFVTDVVEIVDGRVLGQRRPPVRFSSDPLSETGRAVERNPAEAPG